MRLAYTAGRVAWATGHPELQSTWTGTPLLAAVMALLTRVISERTAADLLTLLNTTVVLGVIAIVLARIRGLLSPGWWWVTAIALMSFGPMMSTVWWKQFNVIALALALAGFELLRRKRSGPAAALIGLARRRPRSRLGAVPAARMQTGPTSRHCHS